MKQLFENKKMMIGIAIGLVLIIGVVLYFVFRKKDSTSNTAVTTNNGTIASTNPTTVTKQVSDTTGGTISANSAASKGTLFV
jgi:LPXTG-motif cell wall-anchored protein